MIDGNRPRLLERREFIRHPTDIPVEIELESVVASQTECLNNVSEGGICFRSRVPLVVGATIRVRIPLVKPIFECAGRVVWCEARGPHCDIGVRFFRGDPVYRMRLVEQICHIEHYRLQAARQGRALSAEQAALEWIEKNASAFPSL
jgi:hypothetical protein